MKIWSVKDILGQNPRRAETKGAFGGKQIKNVRGMMHIEHVDGCNRGAREEREKKRSRKFLSFINKQQEAAMDSFREVNLKYRKIANELKQKGLV